jgi:hypothetical protein
VDQRTGKPLSGAAIAVEVDRNARELLETDDAGRAEVTIPSPTPRFLGLIVRKQGSTTVTLWFPSPIRQEEVPASYTLKMYPAETVAGVVQDEQGRPAAGVRVAPIIWTNSADVRYLREDIEEPAPATTDDRGRWQCAGMPAGIDASRVSITFTHPDYQRVDLPTGALEDIRRGKATVLARGLELTGRVVDPAVRTGPGARCRWPKRTPTAGSASPTPPRARPC